MNTPTYLGIDIGTTNVKALLVDAAGQEVALGFSRTSWTLDPDGVHTTPDAVLGDVRDAITDALGQARQQRPVQVLGIGITGMGESGVLLTAEGRLPMPVVAWYDQRGGTEVAELPAAAAEEFVARTGLFLDSQATVAKLLWWHRTAEPIRPGATWLNIPEWVAHRLGGAPVSEPSLASRTGLYDIDAARPWEEFAREVGLPSGLLPESAHAGTAIGTVTDPLGLPELTGAALTVAGHDHPVAAVGVGCTHTNDLFNSCGTADVLIRSVPAATLDAGRRRPLVAAGVEIGRHVLPGVLALNAGARNGLTLQRVLDLLGVKGAQARAELDAQAAAASPATDDLTVTGFSNHTNEVTITLRDAASPVALWLAAVRGAAAETQRLLTAIEAVVGPHDHAIASGGWTRLSTVRAAKEATIDRLSINATTEPGAHGAAYFARHAANGSAPALAAPIKEQIP